MPNTTRPILIGLLVPAILGLAACGSSAGYRTQAPQVQATPATEAPAGAVPPAASPASPVADAVTDPSSDFAAIDAQLSAIDHELGQADSGMSSSEGDPTQ
jgi:hypothetical protein